MIPKIICFIFGHKRVGDNVTFEMKAGVRTRMHYYFEFDKCPRCGKKL